MGAANKGMRARQGQALAEQAEGAGVALRYEAAVAGGIPVIKTLMEGLAGNGITRIMGVMNGSCNYILTRMEDAGKSYQEIFAEADGLGYLEADPQLDVGGIDAAHKPDTFYGLAKCFTEDLGSMYWDKRQLESVHLRILSAAQVNNSRALGSWLSYDDLIHLVTRAVDTPSVGFSVIYGVSNNDRAPVDNSKASFLGYRPKDNAEQFAEKVLAEEGPVDITDPGQMCHGGPFAKVDLGESGVAQMKIVNDKKET